MKVAIAHAAWLADRKRRTLPAMLERLPPGVHVSVSKAREHASIWARRLWRYVAEQSEPVICLNDDMIVHPNLVEIVKAMIDAIGDKFIALHTSVPEARRMLIPWLRCYWMTGPGYVLTPPRATLLLAFCEAVDPVWLTSNNEDFWGIHWARTQSEPLWSPIPSPIIHDTTVVSSLGYDNHPLRSTCVPWTNYPALGDRIASQAYWGSGPPTPPLISNPWCGEDEFRKMKPVFQARGIQYK